MRMMGRFTPSGKESRSRRALNSSRLLFRSLPQCSFSKIKERFSCECVVRLVSPPRADTCSSMGSVTRASVSWGELPGKTVTMAISGGLISGSRSRGVFQREIIPIKRTRQVIVKVAIGRLITCSIKFKDRSSMLHLSGGL